MPYRWLAALPTTGGNKVAGRNGEPEIGGVPLVNAGDPVRPRGVPLRIGMLGMGGVPTNGPRKALRFGVPRADGAHDDEAPSLSAGGERGLILIGCEGEVMAVGMKGDESPNEFLNGHLPTRSITRQRRSARGAKCAQVKP